MKTHLFPGEGEVFEVSKGSSIHGVAIDAVATAGHLGRRVEFDFNEVRLWADPHDHSRDVVDRFFDAIEAQHLLIHGPREGDILNQITERKTI